MALTWRITSLKDNFPFPLSGTLYFHDSLYQLRCFGSTLMLQSSPQNKQFCTWIPVPLIAFAASEIIDL